MKKTTKLIPISTEEEFVKHLISKYKIEETGETVGLEIKGLEFNYPVSIPFHDEKNYNDLSSKVGKDQQELIMLHKYHSPLIIEDCVFNNEFKLGKKIDCNVEVEHCTFNGLLNLKRCRFEGKLKVRQCHFRHIDLFNTVFNDLADFYKCHFHKRVIFLKTDFLGTTVFSASTFYQNALFTYTLIEKLIIFRGTIFKNGLDLSTSIGQGAINFFGTDIKSYRTLETNAKSYDENETIYDRYITKSGLITIKNKRETFRILKHNLVSQSNISESLQYKLLEKETLRHELKIDKRLFNKTTCCDNIQRKLNIFNLYVNRWSNNYGTSYGLTILIFLTAIIPFYFSIIVTDKYEPCLLCEDMAINDGVGYFFQYLLPTHNVHYIGEKEIVGYNAGFYILDFIGRIIVGFGIYQFIQAFRKYR